MYGADHSGEELTIGEDLKTLPVKLLPGNPSRELEDAVPASFSSVSGLFLGLERWSGTAGAFHHPRLCLSDESSFLWAVDIH